MRGHAHRRDPHTPTHASPSLLPPALIHHQANQMCLRRVAAAAAAKMQAGVNGGIREF